ncbi:MAG: hypothetical protein K6T94_22280 [Paenibacillus sp.]|nr:hypothetical protein [Paenibacillus sp.]
MRRNNSEIQFLRVLLILSMGLMPFVMTKRPRKEWWFIYFFNAITNIILDKILTRMGLVSYPIRLLPKIFKIHILFDTVLYPLANVIYIQITKRDHIFAIMYKMLFFSIPLVVVESWAVRNTRLIKWGNGWKGYHTFVSVTLKSLFIRIVVVKIIRRFSDSRH